LQLCFGDEGISSILIEMLPFAVVVGQNLFGAFYSLLSRRLSVKLPYAQLQVAAVLFTITFLLAAPLAIWYGDISTAALTQWWPYLLVGGGTTALNMATNLLIFRYMDAAMGTLLTTTNVVMAVLSAMYVLGERMGVHEVVGGLLALLAVVYALSVHVSRRERRNWTLGILVTIVSALLFSVAAVVEKFLLGEMSVSSYVVWGWGMQWLFAVGFSLLGARHFKEVLARRNLSLLATAGLMRSGMGMLFVGSIVVLKSLCLAVVLAGLRPLFVAFLGAWFLGERKFLARKIVASILAGIGVAIMFWN
jgi:drug/metabolite transporter (DMT)-like permease